MPSGESPVQARSFYHYLQAHQQTQYKPDTWHVRWVDSRVALGLSDRAAAVLFCGSGSTARRGSGSYEVDTFGGYTTEMARPASMFFIVLTVVLVGWAVALVVGHIVWGQKF